MTDHHITSARYANAERTAIIACTYDAGSIAASERDTPALWRRIHDVCGDRIEPFVPTPEIPRVEEDGHEVIARDPRVDALPDQIAAALQAMRRELQTEIAIEHRRAIEALTVASALQDGKAIDPAHFPALARVLSEQGRAVTPDGIVAAADEQARRSIELAGGI